MPLKQLIPVHDIHYGDILVGLRYYDVLGVVRNDPDYTYIVCMPQDAPEAEAVTFKYKWDDKLNVIKKV